MGCSSNTSSVDIYCYFTLIVTYLLSIQALIGDCSLFIVCRGGRYSFLALEIFMSPNSFVEKQMPRNCFGEKSSPSLLPSPLHHKYEIVKVFLTPTSNLYKKSFSTFSEN